MFGIINRKEKPSSKLEEMNGSGKIDPRAIIASIDAPCALLDCEGRILEKNPTGQRLCAAIQEHPESQRNFSLLLAETILRGCVSTSRIDVYSRDWIEEGDTGLAANIATGKQAVDVTLLPVTTERGGALMIGNDVTFDQNLTRALTVSRSLYRDLVGCSSDFSWETDYRGNFVFVGPKGALGYSAHELNGMSAECLLPENIEIEFSEGLKVFTSAVEVHEVEVCLKDKNGETRYLVISALPVFDPQGHWSGARGAGRDVTDLKRQQLEINRANRRQSVITEIVQATRANVDPASILVEAAQAIQKAFDAPYCALYRILETGLIAEDFTEAPRKPSALHSGKHQKPYAHQILHQLKLGLSKEVNYCEFIVGSWHFSAHMTAFQGEPNGIVCLGRPGFDLSTFDGELDMVQDISDHLGITFAQIQQTITLQDLSQKDPLTNLLNRRAFHLELEKKLDQHRRYHRQSTLFILDLDNFKQINDELGHQAGDRTLIALAQSLQQCIRSYDLVVRLGGDEFGIYLTETDEKGALSKAEQIFSLQEEIRNSAGLPFDIQFSIGIAVIAPTANEDIQSFTERADRALYEAKEKGKNCWSVSRQNRLEPSSKKQDRAS